MQNTDNAMAKVLVENGADAGLISILFDRFDLREPDLGWISIRFRFDSADTHTYTTCIHMHTHILIHTYTHMHIPCMGPVARGPCNRYVHVRTCMYKYMCMYMCI